MSLFQNIFDLNFNSIALYSGTTCPTEIENNEYGSPGYIPKCCPFDGFWDSQNMTTKNMYKIAFHNFVVLEPNNICQGKICMTFL